VSWQRLTAKYAGACAVCRQPIPAGAECLWDRDRKCIAHPACVEQARRATPAPEPRTRLPLWAHQRAAYEHLYPLPGGLLAMDMGTGKTATAVALLTAWGARRVLVLCPSAVVPVWPSQMAVHAPDEWLVCAPEGTIDARTAALYGAVGAGAPRLLFATNYDVLGSGLDEGPEDEALGARTRRLAMRRLCTALLEQDWDALVLDESHRLKAPGGSQSMFVARLAKPIPHVLALTGTPMPKGPEDMYAQMRAIDPAIFGTRFADFRARYCVMGGYENRQIVAYRNLDEFEERLAAVSYRCRADDVLDLPPMVDTAVPVPLDGEARPYRELEATMVADLGEGAIVTTPNRLSALLRLQQITGGYIQPDGPDAPLRRVGTAKRDALAELLCDVDAAEPVVVFCRFRADLANVHEVAKRLKRPSCELSGSRNEIGAVWAPEPGAVAAVQIASGGMGIDLTAARYGVYYSLGFSYGEYMQSRARLRRPGQTRTVFFYQLLATAGGGETVDHDVMAAIGRKEETVEGVLERMRGRQR